MIDHIYHDPARAAAAAELLANELAVGGEVPTRAKLVLHDLCDAELFAGPHGVVRYDRWFRQRSMPTAAPPAAIWDARAVNRRRLVVLMPDVRVRIYAGDFGPGKAVRRAHFDEDVPLRTRCHLRSGRPRRRRRRALRDREHRLLLRVLFGRGAQAAFRRWRFHCCWRFRCCCAIHLRS
jgi:hypothetical protein